MNKLRIIIRLYSQGRGTRAISRISQISRNSVKKYIHIWQKLDMNYASFSSKSDLELSQLFSNAKEEIIQDERYQNLNNMLPILSKRLSKSGVTRAQLYQEYLAKHPDGYALTTFYLAFRRYIKQSNPIMHIAHKAGDKLFIDYAGDKLQLKQDDGTLKQVEVFVAILGCSQLTYVEAVESQQTVDLVKACENAFHYYGGVSQAVVPDNLKSAVTKASHYEALINEEFDAFAEHYGTTIYPARVYKPRDKALVENAVKLSYKEIYTKIQHLEYSDLKTLNQAIGLALEAHNNQILTGRNYSRRDYFEEIEKHTLGSLNPQAYQIKKHVHVTVNRYAHARLGEDNHFYSVPHTLMGKKVKISYTTHDVQIYHNHQLVASHKRSRVAHEFTTTNEHLPVKHRFMLDWSPQKLLEQASTMNQDIYDYIQCVLEKKPYPEQAHKSCSGILGFARKVGIERLASACRLARSIGKYNYRIIQEILSKGLDQLEPESEDKLKLLPEHENIRGKDYYQ